MAVARLVCGNCNAVISPADTVCPSCKSPIEREGGAGVRVCPVCGHRNDPDAGTCASCGVRLAGGAPRRKEEKKREKQKPGRPGGGAPSADYWPYVAGGAVVVLLAVLVYYQVTGEKPVTSTPGAMGSGSGAPAAPPVMNGVNGPTGDELKELESAVHSRPNDMGALIKLANALHDGRMLPRAVETYKKYLSQRPKDPDARTDLGICYFQMAQGDSASDADPLLRRAAQEMEEAHRGAPTHQASAFNLGVVYLHLNEIDQANEWLRKTVAINAQSELGIKAQGILKQNGVTQ
jgi:hypothetical protein